MVYVTRHPLERLVRHWTARRVVLPKEGGAERLNVGMDSKSASVRKALHRALRALGVEGRVGGLASSCATTSWSRGRRRCRAGCGSRVSLEDPAAPPTIARKERDGEGRISMFQERHTSEPWALAGRSPARCTIHRGARHSGPRGTSASWSTRIVAVRGAGEDVRNAQLACVRSGGTLRSHMGRDACVRCAFSRHLN